MLTSRRQANNPGVSPCLRLAINVVYVYQSSAGDNTFCEGDRDKGYHDCICHPNIRACRPLEVKVEHYDRGSSCNAEKHPITIQDGIKMYEYGCSAIWEPKHVVYVISRGDRPLLINEILVSTTEFLSKYYT